MEAVIITKSVTVTDHSMLHIHVIIVVSKPQKNVQIVKKDKITG